MLDTYARGDVSADDLLAQAVASLSDRGWKLVWCTIVITSATPLPFGANRVKLCDAYDSEGNARVVADSLGCRFALPIAA